MRSVSGPYIQLYSSEHTKTDNLETSEGTFWALLSRCAGHVPGPPGPCRRRPASPPGSPDAPRPGGPGRAGGTHPRPRLGHRFGRGVPQGGSSLPPRIIRGGPRRAPPDEARRPGAGGRAPAPRGRAESSPMVVSGAEKLSVVDRILIPANSPRRIDHTDFGPRWSFEAAKTRSCDKVGTKSITTIFHFFIPGL